MSSYPADWKAIATAAKEEAGWRCVRCGHPDDPSWFEEHDLDRDFVRGYQPCDEECTHPGADPGTVPTKRRVLTVHHLDGDKSNCRWWNLPPLCQACHLTIQGKVEMSQTYSQPHSDWFLPYVAGYYLYEMEGVEADRELVEERLVECLALGQPHLEDHYRQRLEEAA